MTSTFAFKLHGSRAGVVLELPKQQASAAGSVEKADHALVEIVKPLIEKLISNLPETFNGALVLADGQYDLESGRITASVQVYGQKIHL